MTAYLNQEVISDAKFESLTREFVKNTHTQGVFETMLINTVNGVSLKDKHLARFLRGIESIKNNSQALNDLDLYEIESCFEKDLDFFVESLPENTPENTVIRYQVILDERNPGHIVRMLKPRSYTSLDSEKIKIKICNTTLDENILKQGRKDIDRRVYDKAGKELNASFYDGILSDPLGHVIEGIKTNIFAIQRKNLYTPALSKGGVAGIMRQVLIERAQAADLNVIIAPIHYIQLIKMDAVFLTNSIIGVVKVDYVLRPDRKRSTKVFNPYSQGFQEFLKLDVLKNAHLYRRINS